VAAGERDLRRRIKSVKNIQQITKAMKMVAAARIRKVELRMKASRPYADKLRTAVQELTAQVEGAIHPLMQVRPIHKTGVIVVSSDKGLCGAYNSNLLRLAWSEMQALGSSMSRLLVVGNKARRFFLRRRVQPDVEYCNWNPDFELAEQMAEVCSRWFTGGEADQILAFTTRAVSALVQKPGREEILPLAPVGASREGILPYLFEPSPEAALNVILPRYLRVILFQLLLEARTAELGARLRAMSNATDNAKRLADELTLQYFRIRQDNITREILEVSSGAEALKG
jgi:F-type H+-transporting ATPase subunit gamma